MRTTNRALNRLLLLVVGLALLGAGGAIIAAAVWPAADGWGDDVARVIRDAPRWLTGWQVDLTAVGLGMLPWLTLLVPLAALVAVALLIVFIAAQGRGRTAHVVHARTDAGTTDIHAGVADAVIGETLSTCHGVVGSRVRAFRVRRHRALEVAVSARRGADISHVAGDAVRAIEDWDALLGREVPVLLHLTAASWSGLRHPARAR